MEQAARDLGRSGLVASGTGNDIVSSGSGSGGLAVPAGSAAALHNTSACPLSFETVELTSLEFVLPTVTLGMLNVVVIVGNALVIGAVFTSAKLRTTTNGFVCSLAVADLLVGLMVLPFSNANEVLRYWVFGPIWCGVWLAVDVWLCTASILNLVAISFDRYIAISRPFRYHSLLSPKKGKFLVGFVWILSFVICFPPLIGWNEQGKGLGNRFDDGLARPPPDRHGLGLPSGGNGSAPRSNTTGDPLADVYSGGGSGSGDGGGGGSSGDRVALGFDAVAEGLYIANVDRLHHVNYSYGWTANDSGPNGLLHRADHLSMATCDLRFPECGLTSDPGYIVYSALGSFWIPMIVMCAFYWKIYRTAVKSTAALKHGMLRTKGGPEVSSGASEAVTLRVHRGGGGGGFGGSSSVGGTLDNGKRRSGTPTTYPSCHYRSSLTRESSTTDVDTVYINTHHRSKKYRDPKVGGGGGSSCVGGGRNSKNRDVRLGVTGPQPDFPLLGTHPDDGPDYFTPSSRSKHKKRCSGGGGGGSGSGGVGGRGGLRSRDRDCSLIEPLTDEEHDVNGVGGTTGVGTGAVNGGGSRGGSGGGETSETKTMAFLRKSRRKNIKLELQKLNKEKKAAKTVGIIVGCFVLCWLPFFSVYLLGAFCPGCTPPLLFSIFFWLGYCNSAINPCVYALFSRDFRCAFKKLLRCNCRVEPRQKQQLGFVSKLHSFRLQASSRSNESNSE